MSIFSSRSHPKTYFPKCQTVPLKHPDKTFKVKQKYSEVTLNDHFADVWDRQFYLNMIMAGQCGPPLIFLSGRIRTTFFGKQEPLA